MKAADRTKALGGSDMAAVLGIDRWRSRYDLYLEKTGEKPGFEGNEVTELGQQFEDNIARLYARRQGVQVRRDNRDLTHPEHDWAVAHIDRRVVGEKRILEVKCSSASGFGDEGTDQIPESMLPQCHFYLGVTGAEACDVAAFLWGGYGPPTLRVYTVPRDEGMIDILFSAGHQFWHEHVLPGVPPDPATNDECGRRWRRAVQGSCVEMTDRTILLVRDLEAVKAEQKELEEHRNTLEMELKRTLQDAEAIVDENGEPLVTWKVQKSRRLDQAALGAAHPDIVAQFQTESTFRVLRTTKRAKDRAEETHS